MMREQAYGWIVMTTSSSGLYGNFGQANYGAAKVALVGLMQTLSIEGAKHDIYVNCLAPTAATAMTEWLLTEPMKTMLVPERVSPGLIRAAVERAGIDGAEMDDVILGAALQQSSQAANIARNALLRAGLRETVAGMSLDHHCASGLMAIATAAKANHRRPYGHSGRRRLGIHPSV